MQIMCPNCLSQDLRTSRFRLPDLARILILQLPVRCRNCRQRGYAFLHQALRLPARKGPRRNQPGN
jgi:predicted Zn-ribbon and HTH transcriptional regulator